MFKALAAAGALWQCQPPSASTQCRHDLYSALLDRDTAEAEAADTQPTSSQVCGDQLSTFTAGRPDLHQQNREPKPA